MPNIPAADALTAGVYFTPNNQRPTWPTLDEAIRWDKSANSYPGASTGSVNVENLQLCLDVAVERISKRTNIQVHPVDVAGVVDYGTLEQVPAGVKLATIMQSVRWARRAMTPDGIAGSSEITGLIRTTAFDPDVEAMLELTLELPY